MYISKKLVFVILITALVASGVTWAFAHGSDSSLIHACVNNSSGTIKIVNPNDECLNNETPLDWPASGASGPPGADGVSGYEIVSNSAFYEHGWHHVKVYCPMGKKVLSGGMVEDIAQYEGSSGGIREMAPLGDNGWQIKFHISASAGATLTTSAICADVTP